MRLALLMLAVLAAATLAPRPAQACSCITPGWDALDFLDANDLAFTGVVTSISSVADPSSCTEQVQIQFQVKGCWKGVAESSVTLVTESDGACCGYGFTLLESYLVFAYEQDGRYQTSLCSNNKPMSLASADLQLLGEPMDPGDCASVPTQPVTWSLLKSRHR